MNTSQNRVDEITSICFIGASLPTFLITRSLAMAFGVASPAVVGGLIYHILTKSPKPDVVEPKVIA